MIIVEGRVQGKGRPRFYNGHAVTPKETKAYEERIRSGYAGRLFENTVAVNITAYFAPPASESVKKQRNKIDNELPTKRPDVDNIGKVVLDALNGVAYNDDRQVVDLRVRKRYAAEERLEIEVTEVTR